jgi:hypothetical protein
MIFTSDIVYKLQYFALITKYVHHNYYFKGGGDTQHRFIPARGGVGTEKKNVPHKCLRRYLRGIFLLWKQGCGVKTRQKIPCCHPYFHLTQLAASGPMPPPLAALPQPSQWLDTPWPTIHDPSKNVHRKSPTLIPFFGDLLYVCIDLAGDAYVAGPTACICRVYGHIRQRSVKLEMMIVEMMTAALHRNNYAVTLILLTV